MLKHKRKISFLTLTVFILFTLFSGAGTLLAADKTPDNSAPASTPPRSSDSVGGKASSPAQGLPEVSEARANALDFIANDSDNPALDGLKLYTSKVGDTLSGEITLRQKSTRSYVAVVPTNQTSVHVWIDPNRHTGRSKIEDNSFVNGHQPYDRQVSISADGEYEINIWLDNNTSGDYKVEYTILITKYPHLEGLVVDSRKGNSGSWSDVSLRPDFAATTDINSLTEEVYSALIPSDHRSIKLDLDWAGNFTDRIKVTINGREVYNDDDDGEESFNEVLQEGKNTIIIECINELYKPSGSPMVSVSKTYKLYIYRGVVSISANDLRLGLVKEGSTPLTGNLSAVVNPESETVTWSAPAGNGVATVTPEGLVTAIGAGSVQVTATAGGKSDTSNVYVGRIDLTVDVELGEDGYYTATFGYNSSYPITVADNFTTKFLSDGVEKTIANMPASFATGVHENAFQVRYKHSDGVQKWVLTCDGITTSAAAGVASEPSVAITPESLELLVGGEGKELTAEVQAGTIQTELEYIKHCADNNEITWHILGDGNKYISLEPVAGKPNKITVNPKKKGTAQVVARFAGQESEPCDVRVYQPIEGISLSEDELIMSKNNKQLRAGVLPWNADYPEDITFSWEVVEDENDVIEISATEGRNITVSPKEDASGYAKIKVSIEELPEIAPKFCDVYVGTITPVLVNDPKLTWDGEKYTARFGYISTFPCNVYIKAGTNKHNLKNTLSHGADIYFDTIPSLFKPGDHTTGRDTFDIYYTQRDGDQTWYVWFEGNNDSAKADIFNYIDIQDELDMIIFEGSKVLYANTDTEQPEEELIPRFFGGGSKDIISWELIDGRGIVRLNPSNDGTSCTVTPLALGTATVKASMEYKCGDGQRKYYSDTCTVSVIDPREIVIESPESQSMRLRVNGFTGDITARIIGGPVADAPVEYEAIANCFGPQGYDMGVTWEEVDDLDLVDLEADGTNCTATTKATRGTTFVKASLANGSYALCEVQVYKPNRRTEEEEEKRTPSAPSAPAVPPAPPALESLDTTITVGSNLAIVNGEQVILAGNTLLIPPDRAMVDFADMAKLIPGLQVTWDWQNLSVTFSKDGKDLTMVLHQLPADFDIPFMNMGGRLVVPVRYVGSFFGVTVDWIGNTLVVHMYK